MQAANSIGLALRLDQPLRPNTLPNILAVPAPEPTTITEPNENQIALNALSEHLERMATGEPKPAFQAMALNAKPDPNVVRARVLKFLNQP